MHTEPGGVSGARSGRLRKAWNQFSSRYRVCFLRIHMRMSRDSRMPKPTLTRRTVSTTIRRYAAWWLHGTRSSLIPSFLQIRHETIRISVIQRLEEYLGINPDGTLQQPAIGANGHHQNGEAEVEDTLPAFEPFKDLCKRRFLWYYSSYLLSISEAKGKVKEDQAFLKMPFESTGNGMDGKFRYAELERRLKFIHEILQRETESWAREGLELKKKESGIAANLQRQFEQVVESYKANDRVTVDLELANGNPFTWLLTYFGRPMTMLDGGLFRIKLSFSPRFPEEQPRVKVETPLFHHRISDEGVMCYFPRRAEDAKSHIDGIIDALEEESPPYDPRTLVNPTAAKLYWGAPDEKREYNRRLRRAVQRSME